MSKRNKKGRRHRTVNRTPRPVTTGAARGGGGARGQAQRLPAQQSGAAGPAAAVPAGVRTAATAGRQTAAVPVQQQDSPRDRPLTGARAPGARTGSGGEAAGHGEQPGMAHVFGPLRDGGLGRGAAQTWQRLQDCGADGAGLEELCAAAGFQESTVAKHLSGLTEHALVRLYEGRWYAVGSPS